jgi:hypothetical protein
MPASYLESPLPSAHGQDVVPQLHQLCDDRLGQILVREQTSHGLPGLVLANLLVDEVGMAVDEGPHRRQIILAEGWVRTKKIWPVGTLPSCLLQESHWNPRAHDARRAPTDLRTCLDARKRVPQITRDSAQQPRLLDWRQTGDQPLGFLEPRHRFRLLWGSDGGRQHPRLLSTCSAVPAETGREQCVFRRDLGSHSGGTRAGILE